MAILLITHDLGVVAENADAVAVMYASRIVEFATVEDLFDPPQHPYTEGLFRSIPKLGAGRQRLETIPGTVPNPADSPPAANSIPAAPDSERRPPLLARPEPARAARESLARSLSSALPSRARISPRQCRITPFRRRQQLHRPRRSRRPAAMSDSRMKSDN